MKTLPLILICAAMTGGGIVIYDQLRGDAPQATYETGSANAVEVAELRDRLERLEEAAGRPMLRSSGGESLANRIEALERRLAEGPRPRPVGGPAPVDGPRPPMAGPDMAAPEIAGEGPSRDEVKRFRRMMDAAEQLRREEREREQLTRMLERLEISLDDEQTDKLLAAQRARREKMGQVFRNVRRGPDVDREQVRAEMQQAMEAVNEEFSVSIHKFLPTGAATKIMENQGGMGRGGWMGRGDIRRRGGR